MHRTIGLLSIFFAAVAGAANPDFRRDVRPILSAHCFACHGPDESKREADLRLDRVASDQPFPADELLKRISSADPVTMMPPPEHHKSLSEKQKGILKEWVADGSQYQEHWSFQVPIQVDVPDRSRAIDFFLERRIRADGLKPNGPTKRHELLRRLCFDLTGFPPTRKQIDQFLSDASPNAYESLVDRLLQSRHFGQHMGRFWLDLVRYGDTHGLHLDNYREMWAYRDWVIDSFNQNLPFDEFITQQLAGDLLDSPSRENLIASGYNRLNVTTGEGGSIYDEVFTRNVIDRTDAFGTVFLGLTTGCAVCHDHKFDPITSRDYYSLFAFFNSLDGRAMDENIKNPAPFLRVPSDEQDTRLHEYQTALQTTREEMLRPIETVDSAQRTWEKSLSRSNTATKKILIPASVTSANNVEIKIHDDGSFEIVGQPADKDTITFIAPLPSSAPWQTVHLHAFASESNNRTGLSANGNAVLSEITLATRHDKEEWLPVPIRFATADIEQTDGPFSVEKAIDGKLSDKEGWGAAGHQQTGPRNAWFVVPSLAADAEQANMQARIQLEYQSAFKAHQFRRVQFSVSDSGPNVSEERRITLGKMHAAGPFALESARLGYGRKYASQGKSFDVNDKFKHNDRWYRWQHRGDLTAATSHSLPIADGEAGVLILHQQIHSPVPQKMTLLLGTDDGHQVILNKKSLGVLRGSNSLGALGTEYSLDLKQGDNDLYIKVINHEGPSQFSYAFRSPALQAPPSIVELVSKSQRTKSDQAAIQNYYRKVVCLHPDWLALKDYQKGILKAIEKLRNEIPSTLYWKELEQPRDARILVRGQYDQPGEIVPRNTPAFLPSMKEGSPKNRLGLAQWLTSPDHPLTARVAVNRYWQQIFGTGLVRTSEDFGSQGEAPSHPELLDWLAVDFRDHGWDVKRLVKLIVMSNAYQRSAVVTKSHLAADPENRLLARGVRYRLDAEMIRDQALLLSGLLNPEFGGPSIKPPQPEGLWSAVGYTGSDTARFKADTGDKVYRRSVYVFWKRTSPPPQMSILDAPSRESCTARRERTNTPLQALLLLNETQVFEAAKALASRVNRNILLHDQKERIAWAFKTVTAREPSLKETAELTELLADLLTHFRADPESCKSLSDEGTAELAAWTLVANTLLNLDEVLSK